MSERLAALRSEIVQLVLLRIETIGGAEGCSDPEYVDGLRRAVEVSIDIGLDALAVGEERAGEVPVAVLAQAREAARRRVGLETVLRRYFAGYTAVGDFAMREAKQLPIGSRPADLHAAQRDLAALFDRIVGAVSAEYKRAAAEFDQGRGGRVADRVRRMLAGDLVDGRDLRYQFNGWHVGLIATGADARAQLRELSSECDCSLLAVEAGEAAHWAWLGSCRPPDLEAVLASAQRPRRRFDLLAAGEPGEGISGWRLTHRQAAAASMVAARTSQPAVRYADVGLLASMLKDDVLVDYLTETYMAPLTSDRGRGEVMLKTLRAYFAAQRNVSSAAAALGVARQTVASRLHAIEESLGRPLAECTAELEAAVRIELPEVQKVS